jgi:hypothetical protein
MDSGQTTKDKERHTHDKTTRRHKVLSQNREVTPRMAEANRENARKSTGPRTPEGKERVRYNALKHGLYGKSSPELMMAVGEDPNQFEQLRDDHRESFYPFTPAQEMLCDELALLRWERIRNQRSQTAQINCKHEALELDSEEARQQYDRDGMCFNRAEVVEKGMANMPDCPAKFEQMLISLKVLLEQVEHKEFQVDPSPTLELLYGQQPTLRANAFRQRFQTFLTEKPNKIDCEFLRRDLIDEQMQWNLRYQFYLRRRVEISPAKRNLCFAPTEKVWTLLLRQEAYVDRQIERKTRLLWAMQEEDLRRRRDPEWQAMMRQQQEEGPASGGGGGAPVTGQGGSEEGASDRAEVLAPPQAEAPTTENSEQSRQADESKGSASEEQTSGAGTQGSEGSESVGASPVGARRGAEQSASGPARAATRPVTGRRKT